MCLTYEETKSNHNEKRIKRGKSHLTHITTSGFHARNFRVLELYSKVLCIAHSSNIYKGAKGAGMEINMDFEKAYQNFLNGTSTPEETEFVRGEMKKASQINEILDNVKKEDVTVEAEKETVKKAVKSYRIKDTVKILVIVFSVILAVSIIAACAIGIPILTTASDNTNYSSSEAKQIAIDYVAELYPEHADNIEIYEFEKDLDVEGRIKNARYIYTVEVYNGINNVIEIEIDGKTGAILEVDR